MELSEKRLAANKANAAKSTGPKSPAGKRSSSRNGTRHGILSSVVLLDGESRDRFAALVNSLHAEFQPETPIESSLVQTIAVAEWRKTRTWAIESAGVNHEMRQQSESLAGVDPATRAMLALRSMGENSRHLDVIGRYEFRYDRQYRLALEAFARHRARRRAAEAASGVNGVQTDQKTPVPHEPTLAEQNKGAAKSVEPATAPVEPGI